MERSHRRISCLLVNNAVGIAAVSLLRNGTHLPFCGRSSLKLKSREGKRSEGPCFVQRLATPSTPVVDTFGVVVVSLLLVGFILPLSSSS